MFEGMLVPQEQVQTSSIRAYPDIPAPVLAESLDVVIAETVGRRFLTIEIEFCRARRIDIDAAPMGAYPKVALTVFIQRRNGSLRKTTAVTRLISIMGEGARRPMEQVQASVDAAGPELPLVIGEHAF